MTNCTNCNGEGIVGQGDQPWLKQGRLDTCTECKGTGKVGEESEPEAAPAPETTPAEEAPVDNSNLSEGSSDGSQAAPENPETTPTATPPEEVPAEVPPQE